MFGVVGLVQEAGEVGIWGERNVLKYGVWKRLLHQVTAVSFFLSALVVSMNS